MALSVQVAQGVELVIGSMLYGLYLPSLFFCLKCLVWDDGQFKSLNSIHWLTLLSSLSLYSMTTLNLSLGIYRSLVSYVQCVEPSLTSSSSTGDWVNIVKVGKANVDLSLGVDADSI